MRAATIAIRLTTAQRDALRRLARKQRTQVSELVRAALEVTFDAFRDAAPEPATDPRQALLFPDGGAPGGKPRKGVRKAK